MSKAKLGQVSHAQMSTQTNLKRDFVIARQRSAAVDEAANGRTLAQHRRFATAIHALLVRTAISACAPRMTAAAASMHWLQAVIAKITERKTAISSTQHWLPVAALVLGHIFHAQHFVLQRAAATARKLGEQRVFDAATRAQQTKVFSLRQRHVLLPFRLLWAALMNTRRHSS